jgi:uncharacterized cysteine cluster protein YcgN (CxxCxxCC family)
MSGSEEAPFWETKTLEQMTKEEWEALCDTCGRCCLFKLEDEDTHEVFYTRVICRYFNVEAGACRVYSERTELVPTCLQLDPQRVRELGWIPHTCAYRRLAEGRPLAAWHPLKTGSRKRMQKSGIAVNRHILNEELADMEHLEDYIVEGLD